ncbi:MAG: peptidase M28, partial [Brevundimonas sp.]|nr:peptidase M28 [Brevundimonas sp.]
MRALSFALAGAILASAPVAAQTVEEQARVHGLVGEVRAERLRADVEALVSFGTRHTLSGTASDTR